MSLDLQLELNEGQQGYEPVARDEQQAMIGGGSGQAAASNDDSDGAADTPGHTSDTMMHHHTYEIAGAAFDSIGQVANEEWRNGRAVTAEELQASTAAVNDQLVRTMLGMWRPDDKVVGVRAFAGAPNSSRCSFCPSPYLTSELDLNSTRVRGTAQTWCMLRWR
eukprot:COSAG06_NODE_27_length_32053_cov_79.812950_21_plen_164_part_00